MAILAGIICRLHILRCLGAWKESIGAIFDLGSYILLFGKA